MSQILQKHERIFQAAAWLGVLIFFLGIALFAYAGVFSRFWADDYCYSAVVKRNGLLNGLLEWYRYSGNRLSTLVVVAFADLLGARSIQISPLAFLALWLAAWTFFLSRLARFLGWRLSRAWVLLLALVEVYFAVLLSPDRLQTIYWRMGSYHYTLPLALLLVNSGLLLTAFRQPARRSALTAAASLMLAFFAAGLSETFAALQTAALVLVIAAAFLFSPRAWRSRVIALLSAPLAGSLLMMIVMALAPANAFRQDALPPPDNLLLIIPYSLRYAADYVYYTLRGHITPFLVYGFLLFLLGWAAAPAVQARISLRWGLVAASASLLVTAALIVSSIAPSAYAGLQYPAGRALMPANFALLAGLGCAALSLGLTLRSLLARENPGWAVLVPAALLVLLCLYPIRALPTGMSDINRLSAWSARWDARDQQIRQAVAARNLDITVRQVDVVQGLEDLGPDSAYWLNRCAANYYGASSITAR